MSKNSNTDAEDILNELDSQVQELEKQVEEHKLQEQNEATVGEDTTDERQRAEGIRTPL